MQCPVPKLIVGDYPCLSGYEEAWLWDDQDQNGFIGHNGGKHAVARGTKTNLVAVLQEFCYKFGEHDF